MNNIAIIPARGGSKRIPRKNIKDFLGKPIIAYSIEAAINSKLFHEIMVSTDDVEIAEIALEYGAKVPFFRSNKNSNDYSTTIDVVKEVISEYKQIFNSDFENGCCIYPTAPLLKIDHLKSGYNKLIFDDYTTVFSAVEFSYPIWRGLYVNDESIAKMIWPQHLNDRSQDLQKVYHDAGQWYWFKTQKLTDSFFSEKSAIVKLDEMEVQDIDNLVDWDIAELKYKIHVNL
jgi:N-acylneuraminate cytidylyltransferase